MKTKQIVKTTYIAEDGKEFTDVNDAETYELKIAKEEFRKNTPYSTKYIVGYKHLEDKGGFFFKYRKSIKKGKWIKIGSTGNIKYASKFMTFEDAFKAGGNLISGFKECSIFSLDQAKEISKYNMDKQKKQEEREQKYVKVFLDEVANPVDGEYITDLGVINLVDGIWGTFKTPKFFMAKTTKNTKR